MITHTRRYVFLDFETLKNIKFKKLEKVSDKVFVFVGSDIASIPFPIVKDVQRIGNALKWIEVSHATTADLNYHICFLMGKLHEKISSDVEFAILSNDDTFDPLVHFINSTGRSCVRVRQQPTEPTTTFDKPADDKITADPEKKTIKNEVVERVRKETSNGSRFVGERHSETFDPSLESSTISIIDETARETVRRLIRSGNRPSDIGMLKSYILLHNQEMSQHGEVDKIIARMTETKDINIDEGVVVYNF
jgi:hypothetical protein